ncbi:hypothetical protein CapIbe_005331 [Capra ibex]
MAESHLKDQVTREWKTSSWSPSIVDTFCERFFRTLMKAEVRMRRSIRDEHSQPCFILETLGTIGDWNENPNSEAVVSSSSRCFPAYFIRTVLLCPPSNPSCK